MARCPAVSPESHARSDTRTVLRQLIASRLLATTALTTCLSGVAINGVVLADDIRQPVAFYALLQNGQGGTNWVTLAGGAAGVVNYSTIGYPTTVPGTQVLSNVVTLAANAGDGVSGLGGGTGGSVTFGNQGTIDARQPARLGYFPYAPGPDIVLTANGGAGSGGNPPGDGGKGGTLVINNSGTITSASQAPKPVLFLSANGGAGGDADDYTPGKGGAGGAVSLTTSGAVTGTGAATSLVFVTASGGASGAGGASRTGTPQVAGQGGGATVSIAQGAQLALSAAGVPGTPTVALSLSAGGGVGGDGRHSAFLTFASAGNLGGAGGVATVGIDGSLQTSGTNSVAMLVSANGGRGGNGGGDGSYADADPGDGGKGGASGTASVTITGTGRVATTADNAPAIIVEANGGTGGDAGPIEGDFHALLTGANGARGGDGVKTTAAASVLNAGSVTTAGNQSPAITAQSAGGDGGQASNKGGGQGGAGANGGLVAVTNDRGGLISTQGDFSFGTFAQSVGGTGASGAPGSGISFGGGDGGRSGAGGPVNVTNAGTITTAGKGAAAIVAQSIGGGSVTSAFNGSDFQLNGIIPPNQTTANGGNSSWFLFASRGGNGGTGGDGGAVSVTNTGTITTGNDQAFGIYAQSVGGGGGNGGNAGGASPLMQISLGGAGGGGGNGGPVTINPAADMSAPAGSITTSGVSAAAITAQSVGGGGGLGGGADATAFFVGGSLSIAIGGSGGQGGNGGAVTVNNLSVLKTASIDSPGIFAYSVGGGGGTAGQATSTSYTLGAYQVPSVALSFSVGGSGGQGGSGGAVTVSNISGVTTHDDQSYAIEAMSVGGGGGKGANATASAFPFGINPSVTDVAISSAVGGTGGRGGSGGAVVVGNSGELVTKGDGADAVRAQSIGGGGGDGGIGKARSVSDLSAFAEYAADPKAGELLGDIQDSLYALGQGFGVSIGVGGNGAVAGQGGAVTVSNSAKVTTRGADARGIFAQSVGGGGGTAGGGAAGDAEKFSINVTVGGRGGAGGDGGAVAVTNAVGGAITTSGQAAHGIQAQSIGGGGGRGGSAATASDGNGVVSKALEMSVDKMKEQLRSPDEEGKEEGAGLPSMAANLAVGGAGGARGNGGAVTVENAGSITTTHRRSAGILAQSIGGGGGDGGAASGTGGRLLNANVSIGGKSGTQGDGGAVSVSNSGTISTRRSQAFGILAQSVGGGGGVGGLASDRLRMSAGIGVNIGGDSGVRGQGGAVGVANAGRITTSGNEAHALVAQSIGGGGGTFLFSVDPKEEEAGEEAGGEEDGEEKPPFSGSLRLSIGGTGGSGGNGGAVTLDHGNFIGTTGKSSIGIFAQSIGGGGGFGGDGHNDNRFSLTGSIGGSGGAAGNGGPITLTFQDGAQIHTSGIGSTAVLLQSIGGGGGYSGSFTNSAFASTGPSFDGQGGGAGNGGAITVQIAGGASSGVRIETAGAGAHGIFAQSLGGGGGALASPYGGVELPDPSTAAGATSRVNATGAGGPITIGVTGTISAGGRDSTGIFAQSGVLRTDGSADPNKPAGPIAVTLTGDVLGGSAGGAGIHLDGGTENSIAILGGTVGALSGTAIKATFGNETVTNAGTITGNIDLGGGRNALTNTAVGTVVSGANIDLGGGLFSNQGRLLIGNARGLTATALSGDYQGSGQLGVGVDLAKGTGDLLKVSGGASFEAGSTILPTVTAIGRQLPSVTVVEAGSIRNGGLTAVDSLSVDYDIRTSSQQAQLSVRSVNFAPGGVPYNETTKAIADHLQSAWQAGGSADLAGSYVQLANLRDGGAYNSALGALAGEVNAIPAATVPLAAQQFQTTMLSCPGFVGTGMTLREQDCAWGRMIGTATRHGNGGGVTGFRERATTVQTGGQKVVAPDWIVGGSFAYGLTSNRADNGLSEIDGKNVAVGAVVKHHAGSWTFAAGVTYGYGWSESERMVPVEGRVLTAKGSPETHHIGGRLRAAYQFDLGGWYAKPVGDLDLIYTRTPAHRERGGGAYNLHFSKSDDLELAFTPSVEFGTKVQLDDVVLRPYASFGATFTPDGKWEMDSRLEGTPRGTAPFVSQFVVPGMIGRVSVGLDLVQAQGLEVKTQYDLRYATDLVSHTGTLRVGYRF